MIEKGQRIATPRFGWGRIEEVFASTADARAQGFTESSHYNWQHSDGWDIVGKSRDLYLMTFAAVKL